jgi:4-amino-4-deoxychorismate lyase
MQFLETIQSLEGELKYLEYHQRRVDATLKEHIHTLSSLLHPPQTGCYRCRVIYDAKHAKVSYHPYTMRLAQSFKLVHADTLDYHLKYADRSALDRLKEKYPEYDDILIVKNDLICDTSIANVAFLDQGEWYTPKTPLLEGTTRARLIASGFLHVSDIPANGLQNYQEFALMNAMIGFQIVQDGIIRIK